MSLDTCSLKSSIISLVNMCTELCCKCIDFNDKHLFKHFNEKLAPIWIDQSKPLLGQECIAEIKHRLIETGQE